MISMSASPTTQKVAAAAGWQTVTTFDRRLRLGSHVRAPTTDMTRFGGGTRWVVRKARGALRRTGRGFVEAPSSRRSDAALLGVDGAHPRVSVTDTVDIGSMAELAEPDTVGGFPIGEPRSTDGAWETLIGPIAASSGPTIVCVRVPPPGVDAPPGIRGEDHRSRCRGRLHPGRHARRGGFGAALQHRGSRRGRRRRAGEVLDDFGFRQAPARDLLTDRSFMVRSTFRGGGTHADDRWMFGLIDSMLA